MSDTLNEVETAALTILETLVGEIETVLADTDGATWAFLSGKVRPCQACNGGHGPTGICGYHAAKGFVRGVNAAIADYAKGKP